MEVIALLRGVTPIGKNRIPKMSYLVEILEESGFKEVTSYIQSGNVLLSTDRSKEETATKIHEVIKEKIGADLAIIIKTKKEFEASIKANPFGEAYDYSRIHLIFTNDDIDEQKLAEVSQMDFGKEELQIGTNCLYIYLPREAEKKKLNTNFLEKKLGITATMRKINVVQRLYEMASED